MGLSIQRVSGHVVSNKSRGADEIYRQNQNHPQTVHNNAATSDARRHQRTLRLTVHSRGQKPDKPHRQPLEQKPPRSATIQENCFGSLMDSAMSNSFSRHFAVDEAIAPP